MAIRQEFDVLVIGAGLNGMYAIQKLRETGLTFRCVERYDDIGGTWYKNRYPGCTLDSETLSYQFSFSDELLEQWDWDNRFSRQPKLLEYVNFVAAKFDYRRDVDFNVHIKHAVWDDEACHWTLSDAEGERQYVARYVIFATGPLSEPLIPNIPGIADFQGLSTHSLHWDSRFDDLDGKNVAVIGTGATGIQIITEVAKRDCQLSVFQFKPDWTTPLGNGPLTAEEKAEYRGDNARRSFAHLRNTFGSFVHEFIPEGSLLDMTPQEQYAHLEEGYYAPGFAMWLGSFQSSIMDPEANKIVTRFVADKIRSRVHDPKTAEKLIPKDHGFGLKRVPMESGYYEAYNRPNVTLVDLQDTPIERITATGIRTTAGDQPFDIIVFATGFNAYVGPFEAINIVGREGYSLKDYWADGVKSYLGMMPSGFPNTFMPLGPLNGGTLCNFPRCIETNVDWVIGCIQAVEAQGKRQIDARPEDEKQWVDTVAQIADQLLFSTVDSWFNGQNTAHRPKQFLAYFGGNPNYHAMLAHETQNNYPGFAMR